MRPPSLHAAHQVSPRSHASRRPAPGEGRPQRQRREACGPNVPSAAPPLDLRSRVHKGHLRHVRRSRGEGGHDCAVQDLCSSVVGLLPRLRESEPRSHEEPRPRGGASGGTGYLWIVGGRGAGQMSFVTFWGGSLGGSFGGRFGTVGGGAAPVHGLPLDSGRAAGGADVIRHVWGRLSRGRRGPYLFHYFNIPTRRKTGSTSMSTLPSKAPRTRSPR